MKNEENKNSVKPDDLAKYNRFLRLPCEVLRRHVFHGIKEADGIQTITCLSCGNEIEFHIDGRNKIEKSLWETFQQHKDEINLEPSPAKHKKRWNLKYLIYRGK